MPYRGIFWVEGPCHCEVDADGVKLISRSGETEFVSRMSHDAARRGAVELLRKLNAWEDAADERAVFPIRATG